MNQDVIAGLLGPWSAELGLGAILLRAALSVLFSAVIGCERSSKRHAAGLRTFIFVSLAATLAVMLDIYLGISYNGGYLSFLITGAAIIGIAIIGVKSTPSIP